MELKTLLLRVISSWQVIVVTVLLVLYFFLVLYVSKSRQRKRSSGFSSTGKKQEAAAAVDTKAPAEAGDEEAEALVKARAEEAAVKLGDLLMPLRVAITGARVSPPLFGSVRILGAERAIARVDRALEALSR